MAETGEDPQIILPKNGNDIISKNAESSEDKASLSQESDPCYGVNPDPKIGLDCLITNRLGEFGKYQRIIYLLLGLPAIVCAMHALSWVFLGANVNYRCRLKGELPNATFHNLPDGREFNYSFPLEYDNNGESRWSQCEKYDETGDNIAQTAHDEEFHSSGPSNKSKVSCDGKYVFDTSQYKSSARIDFELICENTVWYTVAETLSKIGSLIGALVFGSLSDKFGRRPVFFYLLCQQVTSGIFSAVAPTYTLFVIARFLLGMANSGVFLVLFVIAVELVGKQKRMCAGICMQYFFTAGYVFLGCLAYFIREWRYLQLALSLPGLAFLSYYWCMPESIRWLLVHGKKEEALVILRKVAAKNKVTIPENELNNLSEEDKGKGDTESIFKLFRYRRMMLRSFNIFLCWFVNSCVYYGLSFNSGNLGGNDYMNFILSGAVEVPAYAFLLLTLNRFGRKRILCSSMISAGLLLIACGFIPHDYTWLFITLNMLGKMANAMGYATIYLFAAEVFPTTVRNSFMGISSVMARAGGISSDYIILSQVYWRPMPHIILGSFSLASGMLSLLLPETLGKRLPETLEDGEKKAHDEDNPICENNAPAELPGQEKFKSSEKQSSV